MSLSTALSRHYVAFTVVFFVVLHCLSHTGGPIYSGYVHFHSVRASAIALFVPFFKVARFVFTFIENSNLCILSCQVTKKSWRMARLEPRS